MRPSFPLVALVLLVVVAPAVSAHTAGVETVEARLSMPVWVPWLAGGLVVAVSFLVVALFLGRDPETGHGKMLPATGPVVRGGRFGAGHVLGTLAWLLILSAAFADTFGPFAVVIFWTVLWAGLAMAAYLGADLWPKVSPFQAWALVITKVRGTRVATYPAWLGAWPSVLFLLALVALEVTGVFGDGARSLGRLLLAYTLLTMVGIGWFGVAWAREAEVFSRTFRYLGACSPVRREAGRIRIGLPAARLDALPSERFSETAFSVALLYAVNHDALVNGAPGASLMLAMKGHLEAPWSDLLLLVGGFVLFLLVFLVCAWRIRRASETRLSTAAVAGRFAAALVPIAVGYHFAHHLPLVVENAPFVLAALADPMATGWGAAWATGWFTWTPGWLRLFGYVAVTAILIGHVIAVVAAHRLAVQVFPSRVQALRAEIPLTVVMVFYTLVGLWLVSGAAGGTA